jgi:hypothetical protein
VLYDFDGIQQIERVVEGIFGPIAISILKRHGIRLERLRNPFVWIREVVGSYSLLGEKKGGDQNQG